MNTRRDGKWSQDCAFVILFLAHAKADLHQNIHVHATPVREFWEKIDGVSSLNNKNILWTEKCLECCSFPFSNKRCANDESPTWRLLFFKKYNKKISSLVIILSMRIRNKNSKSRINVGFTRAKESAAEMSLKVVSLTRMS